PHNLLRVLGADPPLPAAPTGRGVIIEAAVVVPVGDGVPGPPVRRAIGDRVGVGPLLQLLLCGLLPLLIRAGGPPVPLHFHLALRAETEPAVYAALAGAGVLPVGVMRPPLGGLRQRCTPAGGAGRDPGVGGFEPVGGEDAGRLIE